MSDVKFRVAIVGAGIGGLIFAVALRKFCTNVHVDIYESAAEFTEVGAGIGFWPRSWELMKTIGLEDDLLAIASSESNDHWRRFELRKSDQREGITLPESRKMPCFISSHRAEFQAVLCKHLPQSFNVHFSKKLSSYSELPSAELLLEFSGASTTTCDLLVGCDGIKSVVRNVLYCSLAEKADSAGNITQAAEYRSLSKPVWSGSIAYRCLIPRDVLEEAAPHYQSLTKSRMWFGKNKHFVVYPVSQDKIINVVGFISKPEMEGTLYDEPWVRQTTKDEVLGNFSTWEPDMTILVNCIGNVSAWAINTLPSLPTYVGERVALLGDAAHAMTPHLGSGAGQAVEDGFILATLLAHPSVGKENLASVLRIYDEIRRPFSQSILQRSRAEGLIYELNSPDLERITEEASASGIAAAELEKIGKDIVGLMEWMGNTSIMDDRDRALEKLKAVFRVDNSRSA